MQNKEGRTSFIKEGQALSRFIKIRNMTQKIKTKPKTEELGGTRKHEG